MDTTPNDPDVANTGWYLGTDTAIDVVLGLDKVWKNWDYEAMRPFFADSVRITTSRGERFTTADAYFDDMKKEITITSVGNCYRFTV